MYCTPADLLQTFKIGRLNNFYVSVYEQFSLGNNIFCKNIELQGQGKVFVAAFCSGHNIVKSGGMDLLTI
jgi:hypothetical protein